LSYAEIIMQPDPRSAAQLRNMTGLEWKCEKCGETPARLRIFSFTVTHGDLYIPEIPQPGVDLDYVHLLCNSCWPRMLMWNAQLGFDIHTHAIAETCDSNCLTRRGGRRLQFQSLSAIDRRRGFELIKKIDGQPKVNGTQGIFADRLSYFRGAYARQMYYESIADPSEVARQLLINYDLRGAGVPYPMRDSHVMVVEWFESSYAASGGIIQMPAEGEISIGFHAVSINGYDQVTDTFSFWNSWGSSWGDRGYGEMSLDYVQRYHHETFVTRHARWGPSPTKLDQMMNAGDNEKETRRLWIVENPRFGYIVRGKGRNVKVIYYYTLSPTSGIPVTCIELKNGFGLRMCWMFLRHWPGTNKYSEITELYVWPLFRRMHLGAELESAAVEEARTQGSSEVRLLMNEADCVIGPPRAAAREFATACGYDLRWRTTVGPRARMTGIKSI
jgi:GNAT superfamily N-acetyltransferase